MIAATVAGAPVPTTEVDAREAALRSSAQAAALPRPHTSEGRQLRRWLTQVLVTERVVAREADALGVVVTADVVVDDVTVADYHRRNPRRFAADSEADAFRKIAEMLRGAARRRAFRHWLDQRRAALVWLAPGYEHPGDPRQPDNVHRH